ADIRRAVRRTITDKTPPSLNNDAREQLLRKDNSILRAQIDIAAAHIQRLTLENQRIRSQLETQNHVVKFPGAPHRNMKCSSKRKPISKSASIVDFSPSS